jgi:hypothetical protein
METVGPWILLVAGIALLASAISVFVRGKAQTGVLALVLVFGTVLSGTGIFGLKFLPEFANFMKAAGVVEAVTSNPSTETYARAIQKIGSGQIKGAQGNLLAGHIAANPVEGLDSLLEVGARQATDKSGARILADSRRLLQRKAQAASDLADALARTGNLSADKVTGYDQATRTLIASRVALASHQPLPGPSISPDAARRILRVGKITRPVMVGPQ